MRWFYGLFFISAIVNGQDVETVQPSPVQHFFQTKCYKHAKQGDVYDELVVLSQEFSKYSQYTATFLPAHSEHFCKNEKPILTLKLKDVNKKMLLCLPKEEQFLPQYIQDTFADFMQFLCVNDGANIKTFFSSHGKECRTSLRSNNAMEEVGSCFGSVFSIVGDDKYITKDIICRDVGLVKGCFTKILDKYCPNFAAFQELNKQFFKHINKPCSACLLKINNAITCLCLVIALFYKRFI